jgi:hypothetical protein
MALLLSSTDLAIGLALQADDLRIVERSSRYGLGQYWSLEDAAGVIEVHLSAEEADQRIASIRAALA